MLIEAPRTNLKDNTFAAGCGAESRAHLIVNRLTRILREQSAFRKVAFIIAVFAAGLILSASAFCAELTKKTLLNDLNFYKRTANEKKLNANDRYYILLKIQNKYQNSSVDLAPVKAEIDKLRIKPKETSAGSVTVPDAQVSGMVSGIQVMETDKETAIEVKASGVIRSNYFIMRDPDPSQPVKLILDLYGVTDKLPDKDHSISVNDGPFSEVKAAQFEKEPEMIVRVVAVFREEKPYKVRNNENTWFITVDKAQAAVVESSTQSAKKSDSVSNYQIEIGDVLGIQVYPAEEMNRDVVVQIDGTISLQLVGEMQAKGLTIRKLETDITDKLSKYVSNPQVNVIVRQFSRRQIFITGEVRSVGAYNYKDNLRLLEFISQVGGFTDNANRNEVKVYRGPAAKRQTFKVNIEEIQRSGDFSKDFLLEPGDIIEVAKGQEKVAILGDVRSPGYYDYRERLKLVELISLSGGFTDTANISKISVIRPGSSGTKKVEKIDLKKILDGKKPDIDIQSGDTIYVPKKPMASSTLFLNNILPWLSLIVLVIAIAA